MVSAISLGTEVYNADAPPVVARGYAFSHSELAAGRLRIRELEEDQVGQRKRADFYAGLELTGFGHEQLKDVLEREPTEEHARGWREGEALAEAWLVDNKECEFPWPIQWDSRAPRASLPGPELIGFAGRSNADIRLAFGQVKTSTEAESPPTVVRRKDDGLTAQLEALRDNTRLRREGLNYLTSRSLGQSWTPKLRCAAQRYLNQKECAIFGILVRDVQPASADLAKTAQTLSENRPTSQHIELAALYLPAGSIARRSQAQKKARSTKRSRT